MFKQAYKLGEDIIVITIVLPLLSDSYNVTNAIGKVAKCIMFKQAYKLGEDIIVILCNLYF